MAGQLRKELQDMKDHEMAEFIRDTITRLHMVADHLESYVSADVVLPEVGFEVPSRAAGEGHEKTTGT